MPDLLLGKTEINWLARYRFGVCARPALDEYQQRCVIDYLRYRTHLSKFIDFPDDFDFIVRSRPNIPTLTRRLSKLVYDAYHYSLSQPELSGLGAYIDKLVLDCRIETLDIDFTNQLNWTPGDFGDPDGCFLSYNSAAARAIEAHGGFAMRLYREGEGHARCLLAANVMPVDYPHVLLMNGQGESDSYLAGVLGAFLGYRHRPMQMENGLRNDAFGKSTLYLDGQAYLVAADPPEQRGTFNIAWDVQRTNCNGCKVEAAPADFPNRKCRLCATCFAAAYFTCAACGEVKTLGLRKLDLATGLAYCPMCDRARQRVQPAPQVIAQDRAAPLPAGEVIIDYNPFIPTPGSRLRKPKGIRP